MYNFFVLGLVPGTNLQITFRDWLILLTAASIVVMLVRTEVKHWLDAHAQVARLPLHATQLHQRITF